MLGIVLAPEGSDSGAHRLSSVGGKMKIRSAAAIAMILAIPTTGWADVFVSSAGGAGDFFDSTSWTNLTASAGEDYPGQSSQATVAIADSSTITIDINDSLYPTFFLNNINIGADDLSFFGAPFDTSPTGTFIIDGGIGGGTFDRGRFYIGIADNADISASGTLTSLNADVGQDFLSIFVLGQNTSTDTSSVAVGAANIDGVLTAGSAIIGSTEGPTGLATGTLIVEALNSNFFLSIGSAASSDPFGVDDGTGTAVGTATVISGNATVDSFRVGTAQGSNAVGDGTLSVQTGDLVISNESDVFPSFLSVGDARSTNDAGPATATGLVTANAMYSVLPINALGIGSIVIGNAGQGGIADGRLIAPGSTGDEILINSLNNANPTVAVGTARDGGQAYGEFVVGNILRSVDDNVSQGFNPRFEVGVVDASINSPTTETIVAEGHAAIGGLIGFGGIDVGVVREGAGPGSATGTVTVGTGGYTAPGSLLFSLFNVGTTSGGGDAHGTLTFDSGDLLLDRSTSFNVGAVGGGFGFNLPARDRDDNPVPVGDATGSLVIRDASIALIDPTQPGGSINVGLATVEGTQETTVVGDFEFGQLGGERQSIDFGSINVGRIRAADESSAHVTSTADIQNADVNLAGGMTIGSAFGSFSEGAVQIDASAVVTDSTVVIGNPDDSFASSLSIGVGGLTFRGHQVRGTLALNNSVLQVEGGMTVGQSASDGGSGVGTLVLNQSFVETGADLTVGENSTLIFNIDGLARGNEYGAIDVGQTAFLGGTALIDFSDGFDFSGALGNVFDLIIADSFSFADFSGAIITTAFDLILFDGLIDGVVATASYLNGNDQDIFRISLSSQVVPVPSGIWLLLVGLGALGVLNMQKRRIVV